MKPFVNESATAMALDMINVNTDQIFPARFIKKPRGPGYAGYLFHDLRFHDNGTENLEFALNQSSYRSARILVGNTNFGCGSSREGAVYALQDYGFVAVIAPSFGDIFTANCLKNGLLPIVLEEDIVTALRTEIVQSTAPIMTVDLAQQIVVSPASKRISFDIEPFHKRCIMEGLNEIDLTLQREPEITAFEQGYRAEFNWLF